MSSTKGWSLSMAAEGWDGSADGRANAWFMAAGRKTVWAASINRQNGSAC